MEILFYRCLYSMVHAPAPCYLSCVCTEHATPAFGKGCVLHTDAAHTLERWTTWRVVPSILLGSGSSARTFSSELAEKFIHVLVPTKNKTDNGSRTSFTDDDHVTRSDPQNCKFKSLLPCCTMFNA